MRLKGDPKTNDAPKRILVYGCHWCSYSRRSTVFVACVLIGEIFSRGICLNVTPNYFKNIKPGLTARVKTSN
jgi:hypothetical protein